MWRSENIWGVGFMEKKTSLLFVEDDLVVLDDLSCIADWEGNGYQVYTAVNGKQGLKRFEENSPQIVITDVKMPLMDGLEMMKAIRGENPYIQFMILSSFKDFSFVQDAIRLGAKDYIIKTSITGALLLEKVNGLYEQLSREAQNVLAVLKGMLQELIDGTRKDCREMRKLCGYFSEEQVFKPFASYACAGGEIGFREDESLFDILEKKYCLSYSQVILSAISFIKENFADPGLSNHVIARETGMSERRLTEQFKSETGKTINDYITWVRMEEAKKLLKEGYIVYETASMTGYNSAQYFATVFKNYTGMTPKAYQAQAAGEKK